MFKKMFIWVTWLVGCFTAGFIVGKVFMKACNWVTKKLDE